MIELLIENGILLKRWTVAWTPDGWSRRPHGWTPDRDEWVVTRAKELQSKEPNMFLEFALRKAEVERGQMLYKQRQPWPGWVTVSLNKEDKKIREAYRQLFVKLNPEYPEDSKPNVRMADPVKWVPDGRYIFRNGEMAADLDSVTVMPEDRE